jgi:hypothetical protein
MQEEYDVSRVIGYLEPYSEGPIGSSRHGPVWPTSFDVLTDCAIRVSLPQECERSTLISVRHALSIFFILAMYLSLHLWVHAQLRIVSHALSLSSDHAALHVEDETSAQEYVRTDPGRDAERAVLPVHDKGKQHVLDLPESPAGAARAACLTRAPPAA